MLDVRLLFSYALAHTDTATMRVLDEREGDTDVFVLVAAESLGESVRTLASWAKPAPGRVRLSAVFGKDRFAYIDPSLQLVYAAANPGMAANAFLDVFALATPEGPADLAGAVVLLTEALAGAKKTYAEIAALFGRHPRLRVLDAASAGAPSAESSSEDAATLR